MRSLLAEHLIEQGKQGYGKENGEITQVTDAEEVNELRQGNILCKDGHNKGQKWY